MNTSGQGSEFGERTADAFNRDAMREVMGLFKEGTSEYIVSPSEDIALAIANQDVSESPEDMVNHPKHYTSHPSGVECIEIIRHHNNNVGMAIKYLWRNGLKKEQGIDSKVKQIQDLNKSIFFIKDEIYRLENF